MGGGGLMQLGEASRRHASQAAVRHHFVVVRAPASRCHPGLVQGLEPALVEVFVTKLTVEALNVAVLHWTPRLDQDMASSMH